MTALLIGYGNPGRGDDGLGAAFAERIEARRLPGLTVDIDYQLSADHALLIAQHDLVIFADAEMGEKNPFSFKELEDIAPQNMGSHSVSPEAAVALAKTLFQGAPRAFVLGISGAEYGEVTEGLSARATRHLNAAETFFLAWYAKQKQAESAV